MGAMEVLRFFAIFVFISQGKGSFHEPRPSQNFGSLRGSRPSPPPLTPPSSPPPPPITARPSPSSPPPSPIRALPSQSLPPSRPGRPSPNSIRIGKPSVPNPSESFVPRPKSFVTTTCSRPIGKVFQFQGKTYWFSWLSFDKSITQLSWEEARDTCRSFCMDLATVETFEEDKFVTNFLTRGKVYGVWLGGKTCTHDKCLTGEKSVWVWEPTRNYINKADRYNNWSKSGPKGLTQPDNFTTREACLAVLNNWYNDGVSWHDLECDDHLPFVCEN